MLTVATRLEAFLLRVKWTSSYFCGANFIPDFSAYFRHFLWTRSVFLQLSTVDVPTVRMLTSSTYPTAEVSDRRPAQISSSLVL